MANFEFFYSDHWYRRKKVIQVKEYDLKGYQTIWWTAKEKKHNYFLRTISNEIQRSFWNNYNVLRVLERVRVDTVTVKYMYTC